MSSISNTRVLYHPQEQRGASYTVNGHTYTTLGDGSIPHVLESDVAALNAILPFSAAPVRDAIKPTSNYGRG